MLALTPSRTSLIAAAVLMLAACGGKPPAPPAEKTAETKAAAATAGEGQLDIVAWPGYIERGESDKNYDWVTRFEKDTSCKVNVKTAGTSDEMVALMNQGGFDLVTASGDSSLRLVFGNTVQPHRPVARAELQHGRCAPAERAVAHGGRQALRRPLPVGPERAHVQHQGVQEAAGLLGGRLRADEAPGRQAEQGPRPGLRRPDPHRRRRALPQDEEVRSSASRIRTR